MAKKIKTDDLIDKQLGDYKLLQKLAAGGMAKVYIGEDVKLGRRAAIKILTEDMLEHDSTLTERFQREARAVAHLEHENIVPIYQYGEADDLYFLAMKLIEGEDLADELNRLGREKRLMNPARMLKIMAQIAAALDFAHNAGIIHRDVKPSNILLDQKGKAFLTDFGLVLRQQIDKTMGTAFGTPRYISPEQALASEKSVPQSDIYSLAVIVYEILTGSMVFKADTAMQIALSHISEPPPPPTTINPNIPRAVERELLKALSKEPEDRHESASAFIKAIEAAYGPQLAEYERESSGDIPSELADNATPVMRPDSLVAAVDAHRARVDELMEDAETVPSEPVRPQPVKPKSDKKTTNNKQAKATTSATPEAKTEPDRTSKNARNVPRLLLIASMLAVGLVAGAVFLLSGNDDTSANDTNGAQAAVVLDATDTEAPIETPIASTETESDPTETTPTDRPIAAFTVGQGEPVTLYYNELALALRNEGEATLDLSELVLVRSNEGDRFDSSDIRSSDLAPGACLIITSNSRAQDVEIDADWGCTSDTADASRPTAELFWRVTADVSEFEIRLDDSRLATCDALRPGQRDTCTLAWPLTTTD